MNTPWGKSQGVRKIVRGVSSVYTKKHGGLMISKGYAEKNLSKEALNLAIRYGTYYCYETNFAWAIPIYELEQFRGAFFRPGTDTEAELLKILSLHYPEFLKEKGISPMFGNLVKFSDTDLIVSALRVNNDIIKVKTLAGAEHFIKDNNYKDMPIKLLSKCTIVTNINERLLL